MATIKPSRTCYMADAELSAWWDPNETGTNLVHSAEGFLRAGYSEVVAGATARCAFKFPSGVPAWTAIGTIAEVTPVLNLFVERKNWGGVGGSVMRFGLLGNSWTAASTVKYMEKTVVPGVTAWLDDQHFPNRGWESFLIDLSGAAAAMRAYGILLTYQAPMGQELYILQTPAPRACFHYQYTLGDALHAESEERTTPSARAMAAIQGRNGHISISTSIPASDVIQGETDVIFKHTMAASRSSILFTGGGWPESWEINGGTRSAVAVPEPSTIEDALQWRGLELLQSLYSCPDGRAAELIGETRALVKGASANANGRFDIMLEDLLSQAFVRKPYHRNDMIGFEGVNWLSEPAIDIAFDLVTGGAGLRWQHLFYDDWVWLARRFGGVWPLMTLSAVAVEAGSVETMLAEVAKRYSLCISRTALGKVSIWHPAAYRPSFRVHDINLDLYETKDFSLSVLDEQVPSRHVILENASGSHGNSFGPTVLDPGFDIDEDLVNLGVLQGADLDYEEARDAIAEQYAQRVCTARRVIEGVLPPVNVVIQRGDQVRFTSSRWGLSSTPFLVIETSLSTSDGKQSIKAVHHAAAMGLHSCFSAGEVQGIYRWWDMETGAFTGSSSAWEGSAGAFTTPVGPDPSGHIHVLWEGPAVKCGDSNMGAGLVGPANWGCTNVAGVTDLVDLWYILIGAQLVNVGGGGFEDDDYFWVMKWSHSAAPTKALMLGIHRPTDPVEGRSAARNRVFLGRTRNSSAIPIVWDEIVYSQPGVGRNDTGYPSTTLDALPFSVQWLGSTVTGYLYGRSFGAITLTKANYDTFAVRGGYGEQYVGPLRWLKRTSGLFTQAEMYSRNGRDPFYK